MQSTLRASGIRPASPSRGSMPQETSQKRLIALCGKGGSGKTALAALLTKCILQNSSKRLLVIDADPTMNLAPVLGARVDKTVSDIRESVIGKARGAGEAEKEDLARSFDYMLLEALVETRRFSMIVMGRPDSLGCFCPVNDLLRSGIEALAENYDLTLIDGEAGLEQISRQVMRSVDTPVVVSDISMRGFQTAALIRNAITSQETTHHRKIGLVLNRVRDDMSAYQDQIDATGIELFGCIPEDAAITRFDMQARPLLELPEDGPALRAAAQILSRIGIQN